jgi:AAA domain
MILEDDFKLNDEDVELKPPRFNLRSFKDIKLGSERTYLVKGVIPPAGLTVIWGPPKCGKSFWTFDLFMHVALNRMYRARKVQQGPVVYLALEGAKGFEGRIEAFRQRYLTDEDVDVPFFLIADALNLVQEHRLLINCIRTHTTPTAVVIDTLNRSLTGSESDDKDMAAYIKAADAIRAAFNCAVIIVHHCGIDGTRPRGHTSLAGAVDAQLAVKRDAIGNIIVTVERMKDGEEGATIASRLEPLDVGLDIDGDVIASCVIVPVEAADLPKQASKSVRMPKAALTALRALEEAMIEQGKLPPASNHIPAGTKTVTLPVWRQQAYRRGISTSDEDRARQQAFKRAADHLIGSGKVAVWDDLVWLTA